MSQIDADVEFFFVQTMPMEQKRIQMGWGVDESAYPYVVRYYEDPDRARELILGSDVTLFGWTEDQITDLEQQRLSSGKLSFRISERIYREGQWKMLSPRGLVKKYHEHYKFRRSPVYLLCTGAYVASDFNLIGSYPGKMMKWGYFPDASAKEPFEKGELSDEIKLCWAGRLIELKHPEFAIQAAHKLDQKGYNFKLDIVGDGPLKASLEDMVKELHLEGKVNLLGSKAPSEVLEVMRGADIFLFTSNYLEGWGAVVNEAMQSGCAVVASREAGAVPFLIQDGVNGLSYSKGSFDEFCGRLLSLMDEPGRIRELGKRAADTINNTWNAKKAAAELIRFCREYEAGKEPLMAADGPMSRAAVISAPGFIRTMQEKNHLE
jgi:glycosyltransferase involved in cell wall biosynthesis